MKLKDYFFLAGLFIVSTQALWAQVEMDKGEGYFHINFGIPGKIFQEDHKWRVPPVGFTYSKAVEDDITVGGSVYYTASRSIIYRFLGDPYYHHHQYVLAMLRSTYHLSFLELDQFDVYAGLGAGAKIGWSSFNGQGALSDANITIPPAENGFIYAVFAGANYYTNSNLSVFAELGFGATPLVIGFNFKL